MAGITTVHDRYSAQIDTLLEGEKWDGLAQFFKDNPGISKESRTTMISVMLTQIFLLIDPALFAVSTPERVEKAKGFYQKAIDIKKTGPVDDSIGDVRVDEAFKHAVRLLGYKPHSSCLVQ